MGAPLQLLLARNVSYILHCRRGLSRIDTLIPSELVRNDHLGGIELSNLCQQKQIEWHNHLKIGFKATKNGTISDHENSCTCIQTCALGIPSTQSQYHHNPLWDLSSHTMASITCTLPHSNLAYASDEASAKLPKKQIPCYKHRRREDLKQRLIPTCAYVYFKLPRNELPSSLWPNPPA